MNTNIEAVIASLAGRGITHVGLPWYEADDYLGIKSVMKDGDGLPVTYQKWKADAEQLEQALRRHGYTVVRAPIRSVDFVRWCQSTGNHVNAQGRNHFANLAAAMQANGNVHGTGR